jgi:hypothetical protein
MRRAAALSVPLGLLFFTACTDSGPSIGEQQLAVSQSPQAVKSQLRGYDLGPPFPAGFRDSGLVNGYAEGEWVPFVAVIDGRKLADADANQGAAGDGEYRVGIIVPTYSPRHDANGISDLAVVGTYGTGALTPIPQPFDDRWLVDHGYSPFVLGAYSDTGEIDAAPVIQGATQRTGPKRFGGLVSSVSVSVRFKLAQPGTHVELRFAVRLAPPSLVAIEPNGQTFPGTTAGTAKGAADYFPGPGPIFVGYETGDPTGIATVPIRVERNHCDSNDDCVPGDVCSPGGTCDHPCVTDANCPGGELCEDGQCSPPPPPCTSNTDCNGETCVGGFCLPECPPPCDDPEFCDPDPCVPPGGGGGGGTVPCVLDSQCPAADVCEDGVCQPPTPPCDVSCPEEFSCEGGTCVPSTPPCSTDANCPGGSACVDGTCRPTLPPCTGSGCDTCRFDQDCPGGEGCVGGVCHPLTPPVTCTTSASCPGGQACEGGFCTPPTYCGPGGTCPVGELCENHQGGRTCVPDAPTCTITADCAAGESCVGGFCTPPETCTGDFDCPGGELCDSGRCVPGQPPVACTSAASDCPVGNDDVGLPTCEGGFCTPGGGVCGTDPDCPGGFTCELGKCVGGGGPQPCSGTFECSSGETCQGGFCVPGDGVGCRSNADCPVNPNDDVPSVCVNGLCTGSSVVPSSCQLATDCNPGFTCVSGACQAIPGACEVSGDCEAGSSCIAGWCGVACTADSACGGGLCIEGRCESRCDSFSDCKAFQACLGGACAPLYTTVAGPGKASDEDFAVDFDDNVSGGCSVSAGAHHRRGDGLLIVLALFVPVALRRSRRRRLAALAPLLMLALVFGACKSGDDAPPADQSADASLEEAPDADVTTFADADPGAAADADPSAPDAEPGSGGSADLHLITCAADPAPAEPADAAPGGPLDEPCCDPTGTCSDGFLCIAGPDPQVHACRPPCDAQGQCGAGAVCAHFGATDVCIPASTEGQACAPELCDPTTICVGGSADSATCHLRCTDSAQCTAPQTCQPLVGSGAKACI